MLRKEVAGLNKKLEKHEHPKNSGNSSVPPSKDENRLLKTKSLRESTGKKSGGQPGHRGNTLKMVSIPDEIVNHLPEYCRCCGNDLGAVSAELWAKRQVVDIPVIEPQYTEHRVYQKKCLCGHTTKSDFPFAIKTPISYGNNVQSIIGYFYARQYLPFDRMKEAFNDLFNLPISEGGISYILNNLGKKATPAYELIHKMIGNSKVVGSDETGVKINGKKYWYWTWQNQTLTYIAASDNRGYKTIQENFVQGFTKSILIHDCLKAHFLPKANSHQLCLAHLLRELNYLEERYKHQWPVKLKKVFLKAIKIKTKMQPEDYLQPYKPRSDLQKQLEEIINTDIDPLMKEMVSFKKRMIKYCDFIFTFLYHYEVPPDNNGSERAIRNVKVKQKISGQFRSLKGAQIFAKLRSITDTALKNGQNVFNALKTIISIQPSE